MKKDQIERINALARKAKQGPLTPKEAAEQKALREEYLREFRAQFQSMLDHTVIQDPDGSRYPLNTLRKPDRKAGDGADTDAGSKPPQG